MNVIEFYDKNPDREVAWFFVNAEKVFDNVNWEFIVNVMKKLDLGQNALNTFQAIYQNQSAAIKINNDTSNYFKISKGTRQGCPLSPLSFIMVIELLLINIREDQNIKGLKIKEHKYKARAFADDLVFILKDPSSSIPRTIQVIEEFGKVAGFYLNQKKSKLMLKNISKEQIEKIKRLTYCEVVTKIKYLGVMLTNKNLDLYKNNYKKLWVKIDKDLKDWKNRNLFF